MPGPWINDFGRGQVSDIYHGRWDLPFYKRSAQKIRNMVVLPGGGATKRPGTVYVATPKTTTPVLTSFVVDSSNIYVLEWTNTNLRFFKGGAVVGAPYEVTTPYSSTEAADLKFAHSTSTKGQLYCFHSSYDPRRLNWTSDTSWTMTTPTWTGQTFTGSGNRPHAGCSFQRRLWVLVGTTLYGSIVGSSTTFTTGALDNNGIEVNLAGNIGVVPLWIAAMDNELIVGCLEGLIRVFASDGGAITPSTITIDRVSDVGASSVQGVTCRGRLIYVKRDQRTVAEYTPVAQRGSATESVRDLSVMASTNWWPSGFGKIKQLVVQQSPYSIIWARREDAYTDALSYDPESDTLGWHTHYQQFGWVSIAIAPSLASDSENEDDVFVAESQGSSGVQVAINILWKWRWWIADNPFLRVYVGSAKRTAAHAGGSLSGLTHLEGKTVKVTVDGVTQDDAVVSSGAITAAAGDVVVGVGYTATIAPLPLVVTDRAGRLIYRVVRAVARLWRTLSFQAGPDETNLEEYELSAEPSGDVVVDVPLDSTFAQDAEIFLVNSEPQPFTVLSIQPDVEVEQA